MKPVMFAPIAARLCRRVQLLALGLAGAACAAAGAAPCTRDTGPSGITAARWTDAAAASATLARPGFGTLEFTTRDGKQLRAQVYRPSRFDPRTGHCGS